MSSGRCTETEAGGNIFDAPPLSNHRHGYPNRQRQREERDRIVSGQGRGRELHHPAQQAEAPHAHRSPGARQDGHHVPDRRGAGHRLRRIHDHSPHPPVRHRTPHDRDEGVRRFGIPHHQVHHERDRRIRLRCDGGAGSQGGHPLHRRGQLRFRDTVGRDA